MKCSRRSRQRTRSTVAVLQVWKTSPISSFPSIGIGISRPVIQFEAGNIEEDINLEDWQELARLVPDLLPEEELADLLCRRDIVVNYNWAPHVDRYRHPSLRRQAVVGEAKVPTTGLSV